MSKKLQKSLQDYLSKIKKPSPHIHLPSSNTISSSKKWVLKGCKHPKTLSFAVNGDGNDHQGNSDATDDSATLSDVDRFLFENFKSLYIKDDDEDEEKITQRRGHVREEMISPDRSTIMFESPRFVNPPPDLCGSNRFFVPKGLSSSLIEESRRSSAATNTTLSTSEDMGSTSTSTASTNTGNGSNSYGGTGSGGGGDDQHAKSPSIPEECIAVLRYSPNPYDDFRRSMQEMVEARLRNRSTIDWDFMEELLFCYLNLNDKKSYKFILSAFVDLIVVMRQNDRKIPARTSRSSTSKVVIRDKRSRRTRHINNNVT
ncbi:hypothetical protein COLO4_30372 [Corchorus olitorius]|uniref:Transcription repressor n=1 Tax=Corchorus olitorius TaxID=93759 RepID=A0A1R3H909_9ROSI|nr:hypothetical protein COLO4_30372 [Corchorus olitorius]